MKNKLLLILILMPILAFSISIEIEKPIITNSHFQNELPKMLEAGNPLIPYVPIKILLPMGEDFESITLAKNGLKEEDANYYIDYAREVQPISLPVPDNTIKNMSVYNNSEIFPNMDYKILGTQSFKGYQLLLVNLYPYKYIPQEEKIFWYENIEITINSVRNKKLKDKQDKFLLTNNQTKEQISNLVVNPEAIRSYVKNYIPSSRSLVDPSDPYDMIIITNAECETYFDDFIAWKADYDIAAQTFLTSDIYDEYTGINDQEKIKNFIIDAYAVYSTTNTPLEYVILGGDDEIIPIRTIYISSGGSTEDYNMPSDLYYGCLDDNWDENENGIYGEVEDNCDIIPEVTIARFPAETETEFNNIFNKSYSYVENSQISNDIAYMFGENLNWSPVTWGGDYKDEILDLTPSLDSDYHVFTLYDRDGTYSGSNIKNAINDGVSIMNHMGHSNEGIVFGQNMGSVNSYTNTEYGFAYSQGCYPAAFDEAVSMVSESIAENLVKSEHGLYAFVGNTRYGWYMPGSTNGPSQPYDIEFFDAIFNENIRELGKALDESRIVLANTALTNSCARWVHMELVLFGDPSISVKEPSGNFPFIQPSNITYDDSQTGDGDGIPNPGEDMEIYVELENMDGWADAEDVSATITFEDDDVQVIIDEVFYGDIASNTVANSTPFSISIPQDCNYDSYLFTITVTAPISPTDFFERSYNYSFEVSLFQKDWPWITSHSIIANPIICDFNNDSVHDIMLIDAESNINLLDINAQQMIGYPWAGEQTIWKSTALGDIDGDGYDDIIITNRDGNILAIDHLGNDIFNYSGCCDQLLTPMISDIDGDGQMDIISFGLDKNLQVLNSSGAMLANFPLELTDYSFKDMASADLNGDGRNEIVIGTVDGLLHAIDYQGENIENFPVQLSAATCSAPIILDNLKIAVGTTNNKIMLISSSGEILLTKVLDGQIAVSPIAADFDNDGILEIAFNTLNGTAYVVSQNGDELAGWPIDLNTSITNPPLAVDINNDNQMNYLCFTASNEFHVFHNNGSEIEFSPVPVNLIGNTPASVEDIDRDDDFDIISGISVGAFIIDCKLPKGSKTSWKTYRGNYKRTGYYGDNELFTEASQIVPEIPSIVLNQNYPNPFNPTTTISFDITAKDVKNAKIEIYNIKGQKIRTFQIDQLTNSSVNQIIWNGKDSNNNAVGSGIYFYKLEVDGQQIDAKKCLLLK